MHNMKLKYGKIKLYEQCNINFCNSLVTKINNVIVTKIISYNSQGDGIKNENYLQRKIYVW